MQAKREDRPGRGDDGSGRHSTQALILVIAALILGAAAWLLGSWGGSPEDTQMTPVAAPQTQPLPRSNPAPQPQPAQAVVAAPDIPARDEAEPPPTVVAGVVGASSEPLPEPEPIEEAVVADAGPSVEEIDTELRAALRVAGARVGDPLDSGINAPFLLDRGVSAIDQMARGYVPLRALNLPRPAGRFAVRREGLRHFVDPAGYARYDSLIDALTTLSPDAVADAFHEFRPLLQKSYASLGYAGDAVDNTVIAALDAVLATPAPAEPLELRSKGALWAYADAELEARSDLQKQLLRMGPDNLRALQNWAERLRSALLQ